MNAADHSAWRTTLRAATGPDDQKIFGYTVDELPSAEIASLASSIPGVYRQLLLFWSSGLVAVCRWVSHGAIGGVAARGSAATL